MTGHLDGNAIAGPLSEIFAADMTVASGRCAGCGDVSPLAMAIVYLKPNAYIVRCHVCDTMLIMVVESRASVAIEIEGLDSLVIPR
jgi:ribosomal protein S27E